jgi:hypothetical protein
MPSSFGKRRGIPGYDRFRTGLTYQDVWEMLRDDTDDTTRWKYKTRGVVLGKWHQIKMELYERAITEGMET